MNLADLESRLTRALDTQASKIDEDTVTPLATATARLNDAIGQPAPALRLARWIAPMAAAALVVLTGTVVAIRYLSDSGTQPAIRPIPTTPAPNVVPTTTPTRPPSSLKPTTSAPHPSADAPTQTLSLAGALLRGVPLNWRAIALPDTSSTWCFVTQGQPAPKDPSRCLMTFMQVSASDQVSVDATGGIDGNSAWCGLGQSNVVTLQDFGDRMFGGRAADYRRWLWACTDGTSWAIEQYVADNNPGYILFSNHSDAAVHSAMTAIAASSQLPAAQSPLRLNDFGILRGVSAIPGGYHVSLDRVIQNYPGLINNNPAAYTYDIPASALGPSKITPTVGRLVDIFTDGVAVIGYRDVGLPDATSGTAVDSAIGAFADCDTRTVQPSAIILACADGGLGLSDIQWSAWTSQGATGVGTLYYNDGIPNVASGHLHYIANVTVKLSAPKAGSSGAVVWTRATLSVLPPGYPASANPLQLPTRPD